VQAGSSFVRDAAWTESRAVSLAPQRRTEPSSVSANKLGKLAAKFSAEEFGEDFGQERGLELGIELGKRR
jgi:hypothetical protein